MKIVIVGGAGYIGSHMVKTLVKEEHEVLVVDNLSTGFRDAVIDGCFYELDIADSEKISAFLLTHQPEAVFHFASFILVGESVNEPAKYYANNVTATLNLLDAMVVAKIPYLIFSSTAAVYGNPQYTPIDEKHPKNPINPYGRCKWMAEQILEHVIGVHFRACFLEVAPLHEQRRQLDAVLEVRGGRRLGRGEPLAQLHLACTRRRSRRCDFGLACPRA